LLTKAEALNLPDGNPPEHQGRHQYHGRSRQPAGAAVNRTPAGEALIAPHQVQPPALGEDPGRLSTRARLCRPKGRHKTALPGWAQALTCEMDPPQENAA